MTRPKYSHVKSVNALFDQLNQSAPGGSDWLAALRQRALKKEAGWKAEADSYVHGLAAAGAISADVAAACRDSLARCVGSDPGLREFLLPLLWIAIVAAVAMTSRASSDTALLAVLAVLTAIAGGVWVSTQPWLKRDNDPRQGRWTRPFVIVFGAIIVPYLTYLISLGIGLVVQGVSIERFNAQRAAFKADPKGFPLLQKLAREQYGVEVVLGDAYFDWAPTAISLPNASVGSMKLGPRYCHLNLHRANVLSSYGSIGQLDNNLLVQGTMMHEFAHCLDLLRDMSAFGRKAIGPRSLAPEDAKDVKDLEGYLEAEKRFTTRLWREAVADMFTVGYWKMSAPRAAEDLIATLRRKRTEDGDAHATTCWIDHAAKASAPTSTAGLFEWADQLRTSAPCDLPLSRKLTMAEIYVPTV